VLNNLVREIQGYRLDDGIGKYRRIFRNNNNPIPNVVVFAIVIINPFSVDKYRIITDTRIFVNDCILNQAISTYADVGYT
jgi:hypothetical protein